MHNDSLSVLAVGDNDLSMSGARAIADAVWCAHLHVQKTFLLRMAASTVAQFLHGFACTSTEGWRAFVWLGSFGDQSLWCQQNMHMNWQ